MQNSLLLNEKKDSSVKKNIRRLLTGFSFLLFGLGSLDLAFVIFPVILLFSTSADQRRKRVQAAISWHFRLFLRLIEGLRLMTLELEGIEKLKQDKGVIVIANHPTLIDVVVLMAFMPEVDCVVKEGLSKNIFLRTIVRTAGYIRNSRAEALVEGCSNSLDQGRNLIIFPEGTRTTPGNPLRFQRGVAHVALHGHYPIRPVYLRCTPSTLSKHHQWYDIPDRPFVLSVKVGDLIHTTDWQNDLSTGIKTRRLTQHLEKHYSQEFPGN